MDHRALQDALEALHDGELGEEARGEVLAHIRECADCRRAHERWERIATAFFRAPAPPSAAETQAFVRSVMSGLEEPAAPAWAWRLPWLVPALGAGAAALLLAVGWPEAPAPPDDLLLINARARAVGELVLPPDPSRADDWLSAVMEGK